MDNPLKGLGFGTPLGALGGAIVIGQDEVGNPIYQDALGRSYSVGAQPQRSRELERLLGLPDDPQTPAGFNPLALLSGFTAPGNALRGQMMTVGDVWDTAGTAALGGSAMPAPANALRMGAMRSSDDVATRGAQIMDMLKAGRGSDVTDAMLDMGEATKNARLNEWLYSNYDLPMDAGSRAARAGDMGFDAETPLYHGTGADFQSFSKDKIGSREVGWYGDGIYSTALPDLAGEYTASARFNAGGQGNILPIQAKRGREYVWPDNPIATTRAEAKAFRSNLSNLGYDGVRVPNDYGADLLTPKEAANYEVVTFDPANIRSRFARFDPRLAHLRNLSAGVAGAATVGAASEEEINAYLRSIGAM